MARGKAVTANDILYGCTGPRGLVGEKPASGSPADIDLSKIDLAGYFEDLYGWSGGRNWGIKQTKLADITAGYRGLAKTKKSSVKEQETIAAIKNLPLLIKNRNKQIFKNIDTDYLRSMDDKSQTRRGIIKLHSKLFIEWSLNDREMQWYWYDTANGDLQSKILASNEHGEIFGWLELA